MAGTRDDILDGARACRRVGGCARARGAALRSQRRCRRHRPADGADPRHARIARLDVARICRRRRRLHRVRAVPDAQQVGAGRGRPDGRMAVRRRGARRGGRRARRAVRGPGRPPARQHAGGARAWRATATSTSPTCSSAGRPTTARPSPARSRPAGPISSGRSRCSQPKLIVALGKSAASLLLGTDATIASLRGRVHRYRGVPLIVTYHPAYLLRNLPDKAKAWEDLLLARRDRRGIRRREAVRNRSSSHRTLARRTPRAPYFALRAAWPARFRLEETC